MITLLDGQAEGWTAGYLVGGIARLDPTEQDKWKALHALLGLLDSEADGWVANELVGGVIRLDPTAQDKRKALDALLGLLERQTDSSMVEGLVGGIVQLDPTPEDNRRALDALLGLLHRQVDSSTAEVLVDRMAQLDPTVSDLTTWRDWAVPPTAELLAAARRNSALAAWLTALPSLPANQRDVRARQHRPSWPQHGFPRQCQPCPAKPLHISRTEATARECIVGEENADKRPSVRIAGRSPR